MLSSRSSGEPAHRLSLPGPPYHFEMGPIRPPSEGQDRSLLIRVNRNCPWNRCAFCRTYKGSRFEYRPVEEVIRDISLIKALAEGLKAASWTMGYGGAARQEVLSAVVRGTPEVYGRGAAGQEELQARLHSLASVAIWLASGAKTVFLQDANAPIMRITELRQVLEGIRVAFRSVERITSYARAKTVAQRSIDDLLALSQAGLSRLHMGLESGCDAVLTFMDKGVTAEEQVIAGQRAKAAQITLSEYVMPGLGGRRWSTEHALDSARVLTAIAPDFIRLRSLIIRAGSGLDLRAKAGEFEQLSEDEVVDEIGIFVENLRCDSLLVSDQMSNLLPEIEGRLPAEKDSILRTIQQYRMMPTFERLGFRLQRRLQSHLAVYGALEAPVTASVEAAIGAIERESPDAALLVDRAVAMLKQGFI